MRFQLRQGLQQYSIPSSSCQVLLAVAGANSTASQLALAKCFWLWQGIPSFRFWLRPPTRPSEQGD